MDKEIYKNELRGRIDKKRLYWAYTFPTTLNFIRHLKENHVLCDFRQIWKNNGYGEIYNIFDIFDKSSFRNPYVDGDINMMAEGYLLHNDAMFYYKLSNELNKSLKQYYIMNSIIKNE